MKGRARIITTAAIAVVTLSLLLAGTALAQGGVSMPGAPSGPWGGSGMMGSWGSGMMGGWGSGMMGHWGPGIGSCPGMGGWGAPNTGDPITMDQAIESAERYVAAYNNPDLTLAEIMEFSNNFYVEVEEESTGIHAFELLVDRYTGAVYPEPGPNMMWNTKYGHMGGWSGMMGGWWRGTTDGEMPVTPEQALEYAQEYLDRYIPGTTVADEADPFYGYYTIHVLEGEEVVGMLSVNGYTGQVWYHTWHGDLIDMRTLEDH